MKKLITSGVALSAALVVGHANAALPFQAGNPNNIDFDAIRANVTEIRLAGASAPTPMIEKAFKNDCGANPVYKYADGTKGFVWVCENPGIVASVTTQYLMMQKRDSGGSITGVVAASSNSGTYGATTQQFGRAPYYTDATLNAGTCPAVGSPVVSTNCTMGAATDNLSASTANFADVDAAKFEDTLNGAVPGAGTLSSSAVAAQVFGVQVNLKLYRALQATMASVGALPASCAPTAAGVQDESEACMPSLTTEQLSSIFGANRMGDWRNLRVGTTAATQRLVAAVGDTLPTNFSIHACQRTTGSGTQAMSYLQFHNAPCFSGAEPLASAATATIGTEAGTAKVLHSNSGQGDVDNCLQALNDGADVGTFTPYASAKVPAGAFRWAIGTSSVDRNETKAKPFRYIKVDGYAPSLVNVVKGRYKYWGELTQVGAVSGGAQEVALATDIINNMKNADQLPTLNKTFDWGVSGFLGIATSSTFAPTNTTAINGLMNAAFDPARPVNPYSHGTASGTNGAGIDHCRVPAIPGGARAMPVLY